MKQLLKSNPQLIYSEFEATKKLVLPSPYDRNYKLFIDHTLPILAKIKARPTSDDSKISITNTLRCMSKDGIITEGVHFSLEDITALIKLTYKVPRSYFIKDMVKNANLGTLTPLFMYAHKLYNDTAYSWWDSDDPNIEVALGSFLYKALEFQREYPLIESVGRDSSIRTSLLGNRTWVQYPRYLKHTHTTDPTEDEAVTIVYSKEWLILDCQFWLANAEKRKTDSMLLDVKNFGRIPKALDAEILIPKAQKMTPDNIIW